MSVAFLEGYSTSTHVGCGKMKACEWQRYDEGVKLYSFQLQLCDTNTMNWKKKSC